MRRSKPATDPSAKLPVFLAKPPLQIPLLSRDDAVSHEQQRRHQGSCAPKVIDDSATESESAEDQATARDTSASAVGEDRERSEGLDHDPEGQGSQTYDRGRREDVRSVLAFEFWRRHLLYPDRIRCVGTAPLPGKGLVARNERPNSAPRPK